MADSTQSRKRWRIGLIVAVAVVLGLVIAGAVAKHYGRVPEGFGVEQFIYIAVAVLVPLLVYVFGVGPLSALDGAHAAGDEVTLESATEKTKAPAVAGFSAEKEAAAGAVPKP